MKEPFFCGFLILNSGDKTSILLTVRLPACTFLWASSVVDKNTVYGKFLKPLNEKKIRREEK